MVSFIEFQQLELLEKYTLIFILIFTIIGNALVLVVTWRERSRPRPIKHFIAFLAVVNLLVGMFVVPIRLLQRLNIENGGITSIYLCYFYVWIDPFAEAAFIYTLTFISFDRYLKISKPLYYKSQMTTSTSLKIVFITVLISTVHGTLSMFSYAGSPGTLITEFGCVSYNKMFYMFAADAAFFVPITIIFFMYGLSLYIAHRRQKKYANGARNKMCNDHNKKHRSPALLKDLKVIRIFLIITAVFIFCWGPLFIWLMLSYYNADFLVQYSGNNRLAIERGILLLSLFNSICNPIIYACLDQKYRKAFKYMFQRMISNCLNSRREQSPRAIKENELKRTFHVPKSVLMK